MNFLDIKTDFAFKKVFGSEGSKDILINFLNSVIIFENDQKIQSLTIVVNGAQNPPDYGEYRHL